MNKSQGKGVDRDRGNLLVHKVGKEEQRRTAHRY